MLHEHTACGCRFTPRVTCSACGEPIEADAVIATRGPGGAAKTGTRVLARRLPPPTPGR